MNTTDTNDVSHSIMEINIPNPECQIEEYNNLSANLNRIHSSFLFYRDKIQTDCIPQCCQSIFTSLVKRIGGTSELQYLGGWKDLGYHLGVTGEELNVGVIFLTCPLNMKNGFVQQYIENSVKSCPTETVLRVFSQNEDATFDKLIQALLKLNRLDVIEGIFEPLQCLLDNLKKNYESEKDYGYYSNSSKSNDKQIIKPSYFANNLPEVLRNKNGLEDIDKEDDGFTMPIVNKPSVLLTYDEDGLDIAKNLTNTLRSHNVNVVCLENEKSRVILNPEQFIRHYFDEVDYVIPILTEGYLQLIKSPTTLYASSLDNMDCTYARYVYTLMSSHYINGNGCLNKKVRSVLPQGISKQLLANLYKYPILSVWIREDQLHKLITTLF